MFDTDRMTTPHGIAGPGSLNGDEATYPQYQPADHTRVCFAAALGAARRSGLPHGHDAAMWAVEYLKRGDGCLCGGRGK